MCGLSYEVKTSLPKEMCGFKVSKASEAMLQLRTVWLVGLSYEVKTSLPKEMCGLSYEVKTSLLKEMCGFRVCKASEATLLGMLTNGILHDELRTVWL